MPLYYSAARAGFFDSAIHAPHALPADAVEISAEEHRALLDGQTTGKRIAANDNGRPHLIEPERPGLAERRERAIRATRREARRRILATASLERQGNDTAQIALQALQLAHEGETTIDTADAVARRAAIDAIRAAGNALETTIADLGARALVALDPTQDHHWPN